MPTAPVLPIVVLTPLRRLLGERFRQVVRYGAVSAIATTTSLAVLGLLVATNTLPAGWANVVATAIGTVPSFELNRRWVWGETGERSVSRQVVPFVAMSFAGLGLSTVFVSLAARWATNMGFHAFGRTVAVELASVAAFGSLWVAQFVILDRVLFAGTRRRSGPVGDELVPPLVRRPVIDEDVDAVIFAELQRRREVLEPADRRAAVAADEHAVA